MNYEEYLLNELYIIAPDEKFEIVEERSFKLPEDRNTMLVVVKRITGSYTGNILTQPIQIFIYTELNKMQDAFDILDTFSKTHNNWQSYIDSTTLLKQNFQTPVSLRNFVNAEEGYRASVYCYGVYVVAENLNDIQKIELSVTIDSKPVNIPVNYLTASIGYAAVLNTTKISGQELSTSMKQESGLTLTLNLIHYNDYFNNVVDGIMAGNTSGNYDFVFILTYSSGAVTYHMKLDTAVFQTDKQNAPSFNLTFRM